LLAKLRSGEVGARLRAYRATLLWQWGMTVVMVAMWLFADRTWAELGLQWVAGVKPLVGWILTLAILVALLLQTRMLLRRPSGIDSLRQELEPVRDLIPQNAPETRWFLALSVTAGICEELLFRGFLMAYITSLLGVWAAVLLSSLIFGLCHAYQGARGVLKTGGIGLTMAILFVLTGGLWAPMLVHAVIDLNSGYLGRRALESWEPASEAA
jgi:membrane protease YdiL (CAAX protease family)